MIQEGSDLAITSLGGAFQTSFDWIANGKFGRAGADMGEEWARLVASGLDDVQLSSSPQSAPNQLFLPFYRKHTVTTELYKVLRGGMEGGPGVDVLLQIWLDCEHRKTSFGTCLNFHRTPPRGEIPPDVWLEIQSAARELSALTPASFFVFAAQEDGFNLTNAWVEKVVVTNAEAVRSSLVPLHLNTLRPVFQFAYDLAFGWMGDPALSGERPSPLLDRLLASFAVRHVLRIRVRPA